MVVIKLFAPDAADATQPNIGVTGAVVIGGGQVVVTQLLPAVAVAGVQLATGTAVVVLLPQVEVTQPFPNVPDEAVQVCTGVGPLFTTPQLVVTKLLPATGDAALHDPLGTAVGPVTIGAGQVVAT